MRTQVAIVGAGPAGLFLAHLLSRTGVDSVVLERRSRAHVESRVRAGVLEHGTAALLDDLGLGARMRREGLTHDGVELRFDGVGHRIDLRALTGRSITVYGQQEVVKDLIAARLAAGGEIRFDAEVAALDGLTGDRPTLRLADGAEVACDFIAGCDGFHGVSRGAAPGLTAYERGSSSGWLGILAEAPAVSPELIYARHARGFALSSMRTPEVSRLYLQAPADADLADWPDARIWDELAVRLGVPLTQGPILERGITPLRSFVVEPMQHGRLFLAGDAAHVVPPTGAKGLNLAVADVRRLAAALTAWFHDHDRRLLDGYSAACLRRVWQVQHFSWWMTTMLHRPDGDDPFAERLQLGQLLAVTSQPAAAASFAANYVGLPYEPAEAGHADTGHAEAGDADAGDADAGHAGPRSADGSPMDGRPTDRGQADAGPRGAARA